MKTLTYWVADRLTHPGMATYSVNCRTKKKCLEAIAQRQHQYDTPRKIVTRYTDAFDLMYQIRGLFPENPEETNQ